MYESTSSFDMKEQFITVLFSSRNGWLELHSCKEREKKTKQMTDPRPLDVKRIQRRLHHFFSLSFHYQKPNSPLEGCCCYLSERDCTLYSSVIWTLLSSLLGIRVPSVEEEQGTRPPGVGETWGVARNESASSLCLARLHSSLVVVLLHLLSRVFFSSFLPHSCVFVGRECARTESGEKKLLRRAEIKVWRTLGGNKKKRYIFLPAFVKHAVVWLVRRFSAYTVCEMKWYEENFSQAISR